MPAIAGGLLIPPMAQTSPAPPGVPQRSADGTGARDRPADLAAKWALVVIVTASLAVSAVLMYQRQFGPKSTSGLVTVDTTPANLEVVIAGKSMGRTPLTLPLAAGVYDIEVGSAAQRRTIKATVSAGLTSAHHLEFVAPAAAVETGILRVQTEPARLPVLVDGIDRGLSPITVENVVASTHDVSVRTGHGVVHRSVTVQPRETVSLIVTAIVPLADIGAAVTGGWLTVNSPITMQLREGGKVIGTTESDRVMMPAGEHDVEIVNEALGFRAVRKIKVVAGKTATTRVEVPNGSLSLNAQPWAEVWIDGERIGETPIGNLQRPIGSHQVVFRHPEFGERRVSVVITSTQPVRLGVDLRKKQ
ncbi:MAG: PEGA domain-containing protein [Vicinamibacterales bacterium]